MAQKDNVKIAKQAIAAINAHDIDGYLKFVDDSFVGESETVPGPIHGHSGLRQMLTMMFQAFPDFHIEIEEILATGDHVINRVIASGTHKGTFVGIAPTNKKVSWHACNFLQVRNGKVFRSRIYADNLSLMRQLGALPMPRATTAG
jgi:steroid delta-isomerase-like uncharacterized protein